jgi:dTDP-4-dehydrorhamnose reductase
VRIVVLGASGYLGSNLVQLLGSRYDVISVSRAAQRSQNSAPFDGWLSTIDALRPAGLLGVVNTIAIADHHACELDPASCDRVNHVLALEIATACAARGIPLVHVSTDGLFGQGTLQTAPAYYTPAERTVEINEYARSKRAAEVALERLGWGHVVRLSFVGPDNGTRRGLLRFIADRVKAGASEIEGYADNWFTPLHVRHVAEAIIDQFEGRRPGYSLQHAASYPALTKYEYVKALVERCGCAIAVAPVERRRLASTSPVDQSLAAVAAVPLESVLDWSVRDLRALLAT